MSRRRIGQETFGFFGDGARKHSSLDDLAQLIDWAPRRHFCAAKGEPAGRRWLYSKRCCCRFGTISPTSNSQRRSMTELHSGGSAGFPVPNRHPSAPPSSGPQGFDYPRARPPDVRRGHRAVEVQLIAGVRDARRCALLGESARLPHGDDAGIARLSIEGSRGAHLTLTGRERMRRPLATISRELSPS
jgi:hypothetical protein